MKAELIYSSTECDIPVLEHERNIDELQERFICKIFVPIRQSRVEFKNGRYFYHSSEEYNRYVAKIKRIRYL
jgi:hypothetical protein